MNHRFLEEIQAAERECGDVLALEYYSDDQGALLCLRMPEEASKRAVITDELCGPHKLKLIACADMSGCLWYKFQRKTKGNK